MCQKPYHLRNGTIARFWKKLFGWFLRFKISISTFKVMNWSESELSVKKGCIMENDKMVVPNALPKQVLHLLHSTRASIVRMKSEARSHCWWPGTDRALDYVASKCVACTPDERSHKSKTTTLASATNGLTSNSYEFCWTFKERNNVFSG